MNESLHNDLQALVPPPPPTGGWGPRARRLGRTRRAGAVAAAVALTVVGAMVLGPSLLGGPSQVASPAPTPSTPVQTDDGYSGVEAQACADLRSGRLNAGSVSGDLPDGATRAWLCGPQEPLPFAGQLGPREPLTDQVDRIVEAFNALPEPSGGPMACTQVGGLTYTVILEYGDGAIAVNGETVNCEFVADRPGGGARFLTELRGFWDEARTTAPTFDGRLDLCANRSLEAAKNYSVGYGSFLAVDRSDAVRGVVCSVAADATDLNAPTVSVPIPPEVLADLATAGLEFLPPERRPYSDSIQPAYVVLVNRFGDPVSYPLAVDGSALILADGASWRWRASEGVAALWADTLSKVRLTPFYQVPAVCGGYDPATLTGDPAKAVSGIACAPRDAMPVKGPELDPALAREIGQRFAAGTDREWGRMNSANFIVLTDSAGAPMRLYWDGALPGRLVAEPGGASWPLPGDIRVRLEEYGLSFVPE